ncbi:hypothetical protein [Pandoraea sputorum]|uniref:Uncharacterized protein n=1 Tax=Pandoraea sputorum TaxID=93222 RepID=A0A5E5BKL3_9BURK|nr:hypothetical protein [Pandoraea sputorum]VVE85073.1 hypothetical protein PSP31121_05064 [Pandoraea sputorum]
MSYLALTGVVYKSHLTAKGQDDKEGAESSDKNKGAIVKKNPDIKQAEINQEHWKTASAEGGGAFTLNKDSANNPWVMHREPDAPLPSPPMERILAIRKLDISAFYSTAPEPLRDGVSLKKQIFHGCSTGGARYLNLDLKEKIWKSVHYEELGAILGRDFTNLESLVINIDLKHEAHSSFYNPDSSAKAVFRGISNLKKLENLDISFNYSCEITKYDNVFGDIGKALGKLSQYNNIKKLTITMQNNQVNNEEMLRLFNGISKMKSLESLTIDLSDSFELEQAGFNDLAGPLKKLNNLSSLNMSLDKAINKTVLFESLTTINKKELFTAKRSLKNFDDSVEIEITEDW